MTAEETIAAAGRGEGCLGKSAPDEPVFVLAARDPVAPFALRQWAALAARAGHRREKVMAALDDADAMDAWRLAHGGGKVPD